MGWMLGGLVIAAALIGGAGGRGDGNALRDSGGGPTALRATGVVGFVPR